MRAGPRAHAPTKTEKAVATFSPRAVHAAGRLIRNNSPTRRGEISDTEIDVRLCSHTTHKGA